MPIRYQSRCSVCKAIKKDAVLKTRIYSCSWFDGSSNDTLNTIGDDNAHLFSRSALYNHIKKHGSVTPQKIKKRNERAIAAARGEVIKHTGRKNPALAAIGEILPDLDSPTYTKPDTIHEQTLDELIIVGGEMVKEGKIKLNAATLIAAIKVKADIESKKKDRKLDFIKALAASAAGSQPSGGS